MTPPRILMVGDVGGTEFHVGDEAMLQAATEQLTARGLAMVTWPADLGVPGRSDDQGPARERTLSEVRSLIARGRDSAAQSSSGLLAELATSDGLVIAGGGNLNATWPEHVYARVLLLEAAGSWGIPAVVTGQTLGPALTRRQSDLLGPALASARSVGVRESASATRAIELGVAPERVDLSPDDAMVMALDPGLRSVAPGQPGDGSIAGRDIVISIGPAADEHPERLAGIAQEVAALQRQSSLHLLAVPHVTSTQGGVAVDEQIALALSGMLPSDVALDTAVVASTQDVVEATKSAALVIATRYHAVVFALASGVPVVALYDDEYTRTKVDGALAWSGMPGWSMPTDAAPGLLAEAGLEAIRRTAEIREYLRTRNASLLDLAVRHWDRVAGALAPTPPPPAPGYEEPPAASAQLEPYGGWAEAARVARRARLAADRARDHWFSQFVEAQEYAMSLAAELRTRGERGSP